MTSTEATTARLIMPSEMTMTEQTWHSPPNMQQLSQGQNEMQCEKYPVTVVEPTTYFMSEDTLPRLEQPDLDLLMLSDPPRGRLVEPEVINPSQGLLDSFGRQSVTVEESTAYFIEDEAYSSGFNPLPAPSHASCTWPEIREMNEDGHLGRQSVAVEESTAYCLEEGLEFSACPVPVQARNVDSSRQSLALEESTAFCVEEGLEFSEPFRAINAQEVVSLRCCAATVVQEPPPAFMSAFEDDTQRVKADPHLEEGAPLNVATVTSLPAVFEDEAMLVTFKEEEAKSSSEVDRKLCKAEVDLCRPVTSYADP